MGIQGRVAVLGIFEKMRMRFFRVAVTLQDSSGVVRHRRVPAAFRDDRTAIAAIRHIGVEVHVVQEGGQVHRPVKHLDLGLCRAVEETGRIQGLRVEIREDNIDQLLQVAVLVRIGHRVDGKEHMELGPRRFAVLALQVVAGVVDGKGHIRKRLRDIGRIYPVFRILRMIVVAVYRQAVAADEILVAAIVILILGTDVITLDCGTKRCRVRDLVRMGIRAVAGVPDAIRVVNMKHHLFLQTGNTREVALCSNRACLAMRYAFSVAIPSISHR